MRQEAPHLTIADASPQSDASLAAYSFSPRWLPGLAPDSIDTSTDFFGRRLAAPVVLDGLTPGATDSAERLGLPLLLPLELAGRAVSHAALILQLPIRDALLTPERLGAALDGARPAAILLELDLMRDASDLAGLSGRLAEVCRRIGIPVLVEEIGFGLGPAAVEAFLGAGASGAVLTGWARSRSSRLTRADFRPAAFAETLRQTRRLSPKAFLFAADGARDGADVAKQLALGADLVLLSASESSGSHGIVEQQLESLRTTMCCAGSADLAELRAAGVTRSTAEGTLRTHLELVTRATDGGCEFIDLTPEVAAVVDRSGVEQGVVHVFARHTTAAIRVNEDEPLLHGDVRRFLDRLAPLGGYEHDDLTRRIGVPPDEPVNGHSHCRQLLLGGSETLPVAGGQISLGRWQRIFLIELDGPRLREVTVQVMGIGGG